MFNQREAKQVAWYTPPLSRMAPWTMEGVKTVTPVTPFLTSAPLFYPFFFQGQRVTPLQNLTWNLKITCLKRKTHLPTPPFLGSVLIFMGVPTSICKTKLS